MPKHLKETVIKKALILVDVQPTFCEGGELPVEGGNAVAQRIANFVETQGDTYDLVVTTQDWHIDPGFHFSETPDFVDTWPPHGVAGTSNADLHPELAGLIPDVAIKKGQYTAAYSGFEGTDENSERTLETALRLSGIDAVDIVGIAESHCVRETALDAAKIGFTTRVFTDLTVPVSVELGIQARKDMNEAGIELLESSSL